MKKKVILITILLLTAVASYSQNKKKHKTGAIAPVDVKKRAELITDSLIKSGHDTVLCFIRDCKGCIEGVNKTAFVIWSDTEQQKTFIRRIQNNSEDQHNQSLNLAPIDYFVSFKESILQDSLKEPEFRLSHYRFSLINFIFGQKHFEATIPDYFEGNNIDKSLIGWLYSIRSLLFEAYTLKYP